MMNLTRFKLGNQNLDSQLGFNVHLTERQLEVLLLLCEGLPNKLIGRQLGISDNTVKSHVASVLRSLNVATRLEAVAVAFKLGLVHACDAPSSARAATHGSALDLAPRMTGVAFAS